MKRLSIVLAIGLLSGACGGSEQQDALEGVNAITFIQRPKRGGENGGVGDIFQYTSYIPGARLVKLSPPTADGELTVLCCDQLGPEFAQIDISSYDISYDAREIVMSARLSEDSRYGLFVLSLESGEIDVLPTDPAKHYVSPVFMPGDKIMFTTNAVVEEGAPQHVDEYERGETLQLGIINRDGSSETLGSRNLSHRVFPTMLSTGQVMFTQWDHLGDMNAGHLLIGNPDMSAEREAFGKEGTGVSNSYLKAVEIAPGRILAVATSRDRTIQSGALIEVRLGETYEENGELHADRNMSEANASYVMLTPQVPTGNEPSSRGLGRYYDGYPLNAKESLDLLVSWADGPVESETLGAAALDADFGIYLYQTKGGLRRPIWNDPEMWDVFPRTLTPRSAPPAIAPAGNHGQDQNLNAVLIGSMNIYSTTRGGFADGEVYGVRIREGFSSEEGSPRDFGLTEHEGNAVLGIAPVQSDGSWAALIPPNIPIAQQAIDKFGMALESEPVWINGNPGESLFCGGCHEDRARTTVINPGITEALVQEQLPDLLSNVARWDRASCDFTSIESIIGVPWDKALQPIFDAKCVSCHDGTPSAQNPSYTITDPATGDSLTWTFNLSGEALNAQVGEYLLSGYSASHMSIMGPDVAELQDAGLVIEGDFKVYMEPTRARDSELIKKLNPHVLFPATDTNVRAFGTVPHGQEPELAATPFELTPVEYYLLILAADNGGQFYSRENSAAGMSVCP